MVYLDWLGVVCGFVGGFDGDFFKMGLLGYVVFWFGLN